MSEDNKSKYIHPVEELDKIIEQIDRGIMPIMPDDLQLEVELRMKELKSLLFDDDEDEDDDEGLSYESQKRQQELLRKHLEENKRKASRDDVMIIQLSEEKKKEIREMMGESIVRDDPNLLYHRTDEQLYDTAERERIYRKLHGLRNAYYNQKDYVNAIQIIREAINYSLTHDYPWMERDEAVKEFNSQKLHFLFRKAPVLYLNNAATCTDMTVIKGIVDGGVDLVNRQDDIDELRKKPKKKSVPVPMEYSITNNKTYGGMLNLHRVGYDTPMSTLIKHKSSVYNRYAIPISNRFSNQRNTDDGGLPILFDWGHDGAGKEYFDLIHGKKTQPNDIARILNDANNGLLDNVVVRNMNDFLRSMKHVSNNTGGYDYTMPNDTKNGGLPYNEEAARVEQQLMQSIRANNLSR